MRPARDVAGVLESRCAGQLGNASSVVAAGDERSG
jgi:hypothetical protein